MASVYSVKETYFTLQGEGAQAGRAAVFCRFSGCNLWSGREVDRESAACPFCDTDFVGVDGPGGGRFEAASLLAEHIAATWEGRASGGEPYVIFTGGEPALQIDRALIDACHTRGFKVGIESNGTRLLPSGIDWVCISPKGEAPLRQLHGNELKLVYPQEGVDPASFEALDFEEFFLQPKDDDCQELNTRATVQYCLGHPKWRLSLQTHKFIGIA